MLKAVSGWSRDAEETYLVEIGKLRRSNERSSIKAMRGKQRVRECDAESHNDQPRSRGKSRGSSPPIDTDSEAGGTPARNIRSHAKARVCSPSDTESEGDATPPGRARPPRSQASIRAVVHNESLLTDIETDDEGHPNEEAPKMTPARRYKTPVTIPDRDEENVPTNDPNAAGETPEESMNDTTLQDGGDVVMVAVSSIRFPDWTGTYPIPSRKMKSSP
jgi:hypothetical protein